jgi:hypothetical protein
MEDSLVDYSEVLESDQFKINSKNSKSKKTFYYVNGEYTRDLCD